jgi:hypothetical protein
MNAQPAAEAELLDVVAVLATGLSYRSAIGIPEELLRPYSVH